MAPLVINNLRRFTWSNGSEFVDDVDAIDEALELYFDYLVSIHGE